ncbi:outer membrane murein-binding lipoprotein Lpp [Kitasatospora sp. MAP12-15]|uniref:hypothetical protein n=1 Tax=unclassified Kitasatospora TaxID=2633591 RepID=UPI002474DB1E|nr:hypothetical protein [Kitasatospora sp. MAP12-44]MDH6114980.1 outer membrane murein-binding lipoprotein Lpp [Kitasatospora sp. MAP12-44]
MTKQPGLQQRIADTIRPAMLAGLQDIALHGAAGHQRINEWADWIAGAVAFQVADPLAAERDAFADRVDTLSAVAKRHKEAYREAAADVQRLEARVAELEAELKSSQPAGAADEAVEADGADE